MNKVININSVRRKQPKTVQDYVDEALWCKHCGKLIGVLDKETGEYITDGNYCKHCGTRIEN